MKRWSRSRLSLSRRTMPGLPLLPPLLDLPLPSLPPLLDLPLLPLLDLPLPPLLPLLDLSLLPLRDLLAPLLHLHPLLATRMTTMRKTLRWTAMRATTWRDPR